MGGFGDALGRLGLWLWLGLAVAVAVAVTVAAVAVAVAVAVTVAAVAVAVAIFFPRAAAKGSTLVGQEVWGWGLNGQAGNHLADSRHNGNK